MIDRIRLGLLWSKAMRYSRKGIATKAIACIEEMAAIRPLIARELAFLASLELRSRNFDKAKSLFRAAIEKTSDLSTFNDAYVNKYSKAMLSDMDGDLEQCKRLKKDIKNIKCDAALGRWLPL